MTRGRRKEGDSIREKLFEYFTKLRNRNVTSVAAWKEAELNISDKNGMPLNPKTVRHYYYKWLYQQPGYIKRKSYTKFFNPEIDLQYVDPESIAQGGSIDK